jgi:hypothetical protein
MYELEIGPSPTTAAKVRAILIEEDEWMHRIAVATVLGARFPAK